MIKLKNLEEVRLYGRTIAELLDEFQNLVVVILYFSIQKH